LLLRLKALRLLSDYLPDEVLDVSDDIVEFDMPELIADESGAAIGAGAGTGAVTGAGAGVSSFLPQAVRATAKSEAASSDLFMIFLLVSGIVKGGPAIVSCELSARNAERFSSSGQMLAAGRPNND
jgi:hypothetical protein